MRAISLLTALAERFLILIDAPDRRRRLCDARYVCDSLPVARLFEQVAAVRPFGDDGVDDDDVVDDDVVDEVDVDG